MFGSFVEACHRLMSIISCIPARDACHRREEKAFFEVTPFLVLDVASTRSRHCARMAWTLRLALFLKKYGSTLARRWESCALRTLLLPVRELCRKIGDAIQASIETLRCQYDSDLAIAQREDEVEDSMPAGNMATTADQLPWDATPVPTAQQQNELAFWRNPNGKVRPKDRGEDSLGTVHENHDKCLAHQFWEARRRCVSSLRPTERGKDLCEQTSGRATLVTAAVMDASPRRAIIIMPDSGTSYHGGSYAMRREHKVTPAELLPERRTLGLHHVAQSCQEDASLLPEVREAREPQAEAVSIASRPKRWLSNGQSKLKEPEEPARRRSRAVARPESAAGEVSALSSVGTPTGSPISSSELDTNLTRRLRRGVEMKSDPPSHSERKPGLQGSSGKQSHSGLVLTAEKRQQPSRDYFLESSPARATSPRTRNLKQRSKTYNISSGPASRDIQESHKLTEDDGSETKLNKSFEKPLRQRQQKLQDQTQVSGHYRMSRSSASLQGRNSQEIGANAKPGVEPPRTTPDLKKEKLNTPRRALVEQQSKGKVSQPRREHANDGMESLYYSTPGTSKENSSILSGVVEKPRFPTMQPFAQTPSVVTKKHERHGSSLTFTGSPLESVSKMQQSEASATSHRARRRRWKEGKNIRSLPPDVSVSTTLASRVPRYAPPKYSTSSHARTCEAFVGQQRHRRRYFKYKEPVKEPRKQWCKEREMGTCSGSMEAINVSWVTDGNEISMAIVTKTPRSSLASTFSTVPHVSGSAKLNHAVDKKLPTEPATSTRPVASAQRTKTLPCVKSTFSSSSDSLSS